MHLFERALGYRMGEQVLGSFEQVDVFLRCNEADLVALVGFAPGSRSVIERRVSWLDW